MSCVALYPSPHSFDSPIHLQYRNGLNTDVARAPRHLDEYASHRARNSMSEEENKLVKVRDLVFATCMDAADAVCESFRNRNEGHPALMHAAHPVTLYKI